MDWEEVAIDIAESNKEGFHTFKLDFIKKKKIVKKCMSKLPTDDINMHVIWNQFLLSIYKCVAC